MSRLIRNFPCVLPALLATAVFAAAPVDDDLFSSKPGAKPAAPKPAGAIPAPAAPPLSSTVAEAGVPGENGVEVRQLKGVTGSLSSVSFAGGVYAVGAEKGTVWISTDGKTWDAARMIAPGAVKQVAFDGKTWVAVTDGLRPNLHLSADRKSWLANLDWKFGVDAVGVRGGQLWATAQVWNIGLYTRVAITPTLEQRITDLDSQVTEFAKPRDVMTVGDRLYLALENGRLLSSDNGEYWEPILPFSDFDKVERAFYAEGNDSAVFVPLRGTGAKRELAVKVQHGGADWSTVATPFKDVRGLAYGRGRFVAVAATVQGTGQEVALHESANGDTWTRVAALDPLTTGLAFGPAGFIASGPGGKIAVYQPAPLADKPAFARAATPIPAIQFRNFGTTVSGHGKYRKDEGATTPDQLRVKQLSELLTKARAGDAAAKREVALAVAEAKHALSNPWGAEQLFKEAAAAGDAIAPRGYAELLAKWKPTTPTKDLLALYRQSAERGDVPALVWLAENLSSTDAATAAERKKWATVAAEKDAAFRAREKDRTDYADALPKAEAGDPTACKLAATLLLAGKGVPKDEAKAEAFLRTASAKKDARAMFLLADLLERQTGGTDFSRELLAAEYRQLLTDAAAAGETAALQRLADNYANGRHSFPKDELRAYAAHVKLAEQNHAPSMVVVGRILYSGGLPGVPKDEAQGEAWVRKAVAANDRDGKKLLVEIEGLKARAAARLPLDAKIAGVTPEVFNALEKIQAAAAPQFDDAALLELFSAVWYDADYSTLDEDLGQELAAAARPVTVAGADGRTLSFTKPVPATVAANFAQIFPATFNPANVQYHFALWQRTANAGVLVAAVKSSPQAAYQAKSGIADALFQAAQVDQRDSTGKTKTAADFYLRLKKSHDDAGLAVQKEFRALVREAIDQAIRTAEQVGNRKISTYRLGEWLKEPAAVSAPAAPPPAAPAATTKP